ncbi:MAG: RNA polymerase sigma factor [Planctomycetota bacterium]
MTLSLDDGDQALIAAAQRGERFAIDALIRRHDTWVRNVVYATTTQPGTVDDIVQTVWAKVWRQIGTLVDPSRWRSWLYRLAKNTAIDAGVRTAAERRRRVAFEGVRCTEEASSDPHAVAARREEHQRVLGAIHGLPAIYREPFILRHLEDWSYAQIGEAMGMPVDTVETRLVRARRLLRSALHRPGTGTSEKAAE